MFLQENPVIPGNQFGGGAPETAESEIQGGVVGDLGEVEMSQVDSAQVRTSPVFNVVSMNPQIHLTYLHDVSMHY